jgi:hypothetical protein
MKITKTLTILLPVAFIGGTAAWGGQIALGTSNVIGGSATYSGAWNGSASGGIYNATHIFDIPTGPVGAGSLYWRCSGCGDPYISIDLGAPYVITSVELFNTRDNGSIYIGIADFYLAAGNSKVWNALDQGYRLSGDTTTILSNTLTTSSDNPVPGQTFSVSDTGAYRYLELRPTSLPPLALAYGLYQMRVFGDEGSAPEPACFGLIGLGLSTCLLASRRRAQ